MVSLDAPGLVQPVTACGGIVDHSCGQRPSNKKDIRLGGREKRSLLVPNGIPANPAQIEQYASHSGLIIG